MQSRARGIFPFIVEKAFFCQSKQIPGEKAATRSARPEV